MIATRKKFNASQLCKPEIDTCAVVHCPLYTYALSKVKNCAQCEFYLGCIDIYKNKKIDDTEIQWAGRYRVVCAYPGVRRCDMLIPDLSDKKER